MNTPVASDDTAQARIWDPFVRYGHWALAVAFAIAYLTEDDLLSVHVWAGYLVGGIVVLRILWGLVGTKHARFGDFFFSPRQALGYLCDLFRGSAKRYLGHSPAGAVMVFALLTALLATTGSGLMVYALDKHAEDFWEETHEVLANVTLLLVALHIAGVVVSSFAHRENLIRAMVTGRKRIEL